MICAILALFSLFSPAMSAARERTFLMIKPDGVHRGLVGKIIQRFEEKGFKLVAMKYMWVRIATQRIAPVEDPAFLGFFDPETLPKSFLLLFSAHPLNYSPVSFGFYESFNLLIT
jgi:Nucleoside diphosphate kinase